MIVHSFLKMRWINSTILLLQFLVLKIAVISGPFLNQILFENKLCDIISQVFFCVARKGSVNKLSCEQIVTWKLE